MTNNAWIVLTILATFPHLRRDCTAKEWGTLSMGMEFTWMTRSFSLEREKTGTILVQTEHGSSEEPKTGHVDWSFPFFNFTRSCGYWGCGTVGFACYSLRISSPGGTLRCFEPCQNIWVLQRDLSLNHTTAAQLGVSESPAMVCILEACWQHSFRSYYCGSPRSSPSF